MKGWPFILLLFPFPALAQEPAPLSSAPHVSLHEAIQRAEAQSPTTAIARAEVRRANAIVEEVRAGWLPTLSAGALYTQLDADRLNATGGIVAPATQINVSATLVVPIVAPQRWAQWSHAQDAEDTARAANDEARWQVAVAVTRAYLTVVAQHRIVEQLGSARATAAEHVDFAHQRLAGGIGNRIDEVRAAQDLATATAQLSAAISVLVRAREQLGVLVGGRGALDADESGLGPDDVPGDERRLLDGVDARPDLHTAHERITAAQRVVRDDWVDYLPTLVGTFQPFIQDPPTLTLPSTGWQATLALVVPLYDGGYRYGAARERDALLDEARAQEDALRRQARSDVRAALEDVRRADEALATTHDAARLADETLALATTAYQAGATTSLEVIDAQRRARDAAIAAAIAEDAARQARLNLMVASGRTLD